jgi:hypothetical protein
MIFIQVCLSPFVVYKSLRFRYSTFTIRVPKNSEGRILNDHQDIFSTRYMPYNAYYIRGNTTCHECIGEKKLNLRLIRVTLKGVIPIFKF